MARKPTRAPVSGTIQRTVEVNPAECGSAWRKDQVTDRAYRYRSNSPDCRPEGEKICPFCGAKGKVEVHHIDGHEENVTRENLSWACRRCNVKIGRVMQSAGLGRRAHRFNPAEGATSLGQWLTAVLSARGESDSMTVRQAVAMIRATSPRMRSSFAREIWKRRKARQGEVPF